MTSKKCNGCRYYMEGIVKCYNENKECINNINTENLFEVVPPVPHDISKQLFSTNEYNEIVPVKIVEAKWDLVYQRYMYFDEKRYGRFSDWFYNTKQEAIDYICNREYNNKIKDLNLSIEYLENQKKKFLKYYK